ncbi:hypothetical protein ACVNP1_12605 [Staphylococcus aureus]
MNNIFKLEINTETYRYLIRLHSSLECNGETVEIETDKGKRLIIKLETISEPDENGNRTIYYAMNGQARRIYIKDENVHTNANVKPKADKSNPSHIGAQMPGSVTESRLV